MAIQDEMYKAIEIEINQAVNNDKGLIVDIDKAKLVAKTLTELAVGPGDAQNLTIQYIGNIKNICK